MRTLSYLAAVTLLTLAGVACSDSGSPTAPPTNAGNAISPTLVSSTGAATTIKSISASGMCLDITGAGTAAGTAAQLYQCYSSNVNQQFSWLGTGEIRVYGTMCLDAQQGQNWTRVVINSCNGGASQKWTATSASEIRGLNNRCVDISGNSTSNFATIQMYDCTGGNNQKWDNGLSTTVVGGGGSTAPAGSIVLSPGDNLQAKVSAAPTGSNFRLKAGTYSAQQIVPKTGMSFYGDTGAVMDGQGSTPYAFSRGSAPYPNNVRIQNITIQNYSPPDQVGAVNAGGPTGPENTSGWVIQDCEIRNNATGGIRIGTGTQVIHNFVHNNGQIGIVGVGDNVLVQNNEISYNNSAHFDPGWEGGGTKFVETNGLVLRGNYVHNNYGAGLWLDTDNINALIETNRVEYNDREGIFEEISYAAVIRNNSVTGNGFNAAGWLYGAGIMISSSANAEVYGNTVVNNYNGITAVQQNRGTGAYGTHTTQNVYVHDNQITMTVGRTGIGEDVGNKLVFTSTNNRFVNDTYYLGSAVRYFEWDDGQHTESEWQAYGQDKTGTFHR